MVLIIMKLETLILRKISIKLNGPFKHRDLENITLGLFNSPY